MTPTDPCKGTYPTADKPKPMRALFLITWLALGAVAMAKPLFDQYGFFAVEAPDDWRPGSDPLGLNLAGSVWLTNKERKSVMGVATLPANSPEEKKVAVGMVGSALNDQLVSKGFHCSMSPLTVAGEPGGVIQGVNKAHERIAVVVTRRDSAVAITFYIVDSSVSTETYGANLKGLVDGFRWAKAKPAKPASK